MTPTSQQTAISAPIEPSDDSYSLISNQKLLDLYATMLKCRMIHEHVHILFNQSKLNGNHPVPPGSEAAAVAVTTDLLPGDTICPKPSDIVPLFIKGAPLKSLLISLSSHSSLAPNHLKTAIKAATSHKSNKNNKISVVTSSSESISLDSWLEALSVASSKNLPMIFLSWHSASPHPSIADLSVKSTQTGSKTASRSFPHIAVDGNDVVAIYRVASEAITHARRGNGPTLIECQAYHSDDDDPILNMEKYLTSKGLFSQKFKAAEIARFRRQLDAASVS